MRKIYYLLIFIFSFSVLSAQEKLSNEEKARREKNIQVGNLFAKYGYKAKVATLSKGKYLEFHDLDSIVTIGTSRWHVDNKKIVGDIVFDSLNVDAQPIGDAPGMWMSPDPLSEEYPDYSPYTFVLNNPLKYTDPTGMAPEECCPNLINAFKGIYGSVKSEVVGTYNFVTSDAYKSETWKGAGNMLLGSMAMSGPAGNIANAFALDAKFGTNSVGAVQGMTASMESFGNDLISGDVQKTAGALTTAALMFAPSKLDDLAKLGKVGKIDIPSNNKVDFVVTPKGEAISIPNGATGPTNPNKGSGMMYQGGSGGKGMDKKTTGVRIMDANSNQGKRVNYMNKNGQTVDPSSGKTISNKDKRGHLPLK